MKAPNTFKLLPKVCTLLFGIVMCALTVNGNESFYSDDHKEVIRHRVDNLDDRLKYHFTSEVDSFINIYYTKRISVVTKGLRRSETYFPYIDSVFVAHNIPYKLRYLAVVESLMDPKAVSHAGATGMWQFMPGTGKMYGLKVTDEVDERLDYKKSTVAAANYLKDLKDQFGDWLLAMAAYNCGPGNIRSFIRRSKGNYNYEKIKHRLPKETFEYIPKFTAISYLMEYAPEYKLVPRRPSVKLLNTLPHRSTFKSVDSLEEKKTETAEVELETEPCIGECLDVDEPKSTFAKFWEVIVDTFSPREG